MEVVEIIKHIDTRGRLGYSNDFDLLRFKRCYHIFHDDRDAIRAWQGHKIETKAFWVTQGSFNLSLIEIDDFSNANANLDIHNYELNFSQPRIIVVPPGWANGLKANEKKSSVMVFSDKNLIEASQDNYRWEFDYFKNANWI